ncbi:probable beta-1,3-galactosyltransferase 2 isoform X1 [Tanacetum coccineum]
MAQEIEKFPAEMADDEKRARATPINSESNPDSSMLESIVNGSLISEENTRSSVERKKCLMVVGVNTAFSYRERRGSVRATWIHQGKWVKNRSKCGDNVFVGLNTDVPWIMCRQDDGCDSIVSMAIKMATVFKAEELSEKLM